jgi:hypothetical protein
VAVDDASRNIPPILLAHRRDFKALRIELGPWQSTMFTRRHDPVLRAVPEPMHEPLAGPHILVDELLLCFPDPPLSSLGDLWHDELFISESAQFATSSGTLDWVAPGYQEDLSMQTRFTSSSWPLFD